MKWRVRESSHGGYECERYMEKSSSFIMGDVVYESAHFETRRQAEAYIKRHGGEVEETTG